MSDKTGARLKARRLALGLTQDDIAVYIGTSQKQVSRYELGLNDPTGDVLLKMSEILNTSVDYLLGKTDKEMAALDLSDIESHLVDAFRRGDVAMVIDILSSNRGSATARR